MTDPSPPDRAHNLAFQLGRKAVLYAGTMDQKKPSSYYIQAGYWIGSRRWWVDVRLRCKECPNAEPPSDPETCRRFDILHDFVFRVSGESANSTFVRFRNEFDSLISSRA